MERQIGLGCGVSGTLVRRAALRVGLGRGMDEEATLFERVGGREGVHAVIWRFYELVESDVELRAIYPEDLAPGREKLFLFMEQWLGGEPRYSELYGHPRLRMRHFPFAITEHGTGRWLRHMRQAMRDTGVGDEEQREIFAAWGPLARHMINQ